MQYTRNILCIFALFFLLIFQSCSDDATSPVQSNENGNSDLTDNEQLLQNDQPLQNEQNNLVADIQFYSPRTIDVNLVNAWGIAITPSGDFWVSANQTASANIYDKNGNIEMPRITITGAGGHYGAPTGVVYNPTTDFKILTIPAEFIFAGEDGTISGWSSSFYGSSSNVAVDRSSHHSVYKGLAIGKLNGDNHIYAADFRNSKVDVFDKNFIYKPNTRLLDPTIPSGYAPFNVANIDGELFVSYAKQKLPAKIKDEPGAGHGFVNVYRTDGTLIRRLASNGALNSPWGMVDTREFGNQGGDILIGNHGDGRINIYDRKGTYKGQVKDNRGQPITIAGLWGITFIANGGSDGKLYFTAGPDGELHGLFGSLKLR